MEYSMDILERLIGSLFLIITMIWVGVYIYSRLLGTSMKGRMDIIRVVTSSYIGSRKMIAVVNIAGDYHVLGITPDNITYLTRIEDSGVIEDIERGETVQDISSFRKIINRINNPRIRIQITK